MSARTYTWYIFFMLIVFITLYIVDYFFNSFVFSKFGVLMFPEISSAMMQHDFMVFGL